LNDPIHYQTIGEFHEPIRTGKISPVDVVEACLTRIHRLNPTLNAFITVFDDEARPLAKQAEAEINAGRWNGPLHGIPVGIKDFYDTAGSRTTAAFEPFKNRIPKKDAAGVAKTQGGRCDCRRQNQHAPARDGDDRARERFRPRAAILWLSHPGITTRSVTDTAVVLNALAGQDGKGARQEFHAEALRETKLRVGVADNFKAQPEITDAFKRAIESMRALGHAIATAHAPFEIPPFGDLRAIQEDRETIADRAFKDVDVIVLPTTATIVLAVKDASANKLLWTAGHQRSLRCRSARPSDGTADRRQASR